MKKLYKFLGVIAVIAVIGSALAACKTEEDTPVTPPVTGDVYLLQWGATEPGSVTYEDVYNFIEKEDLTYTRISGNAAAYGTKKDAQKAYAALVDEDYFMDNGTKEGAFEDLLETKVEGIGAPKALKTKLQDEKGNVPVGGIFPASAEGNAFAIMFYITKK